MPKDKFSQLSYLSVTESAANTLTFAGLSVFSNILSNQGMIIHRAAYHWRRGDWASFGAAADQLTFGLSGEEVSTISMDDPSVYDYNDVTRVDWGTAGSADLKYQPLEKNWTGLPGGGLLVPADRLYAYVQGVLMDAAVVLTVRVWFSLLEMAPADYLELAQAMRVLR